MPFMAKAYYASAVPNVHGYCKKYLEIFKYREHINANRYNIVYTSDRDCIFRN